MSPSILPTALNLGSGKDFRDEFLNIDVDDSWGPDAVCDISTLDLARGHDLSTSRFGPVTLRPGLFDLVIANDVLEHVPNLMAMMTNVLTLLRLDGLFQISVPYDLSYGAWQDPTHVRAFNERSWLYYTEWFWYMGWSEFRFALEKFDFVPSQTGEALREQGVSRDDILRTPRAIDSMSVVLRKVALTVDDRLTWEQWRNRRRQAAMRNQGTRETVEATVADRSKAQSPLAAFDGMAADLRDRYCIWIVTPPDYTHQHAYDDVAHGLSAAFAELGGTAPVIEDLNDARGRAPIILGPQLLPIEILPILPRDCVLFNLEQVDRKSPWMRDDYIRLMQARPVVDYSVRNQAALRGLGVTHAKLLPLGYAPALTRIAPAPAQDIDVLFYGSINERRRSILDALIRRGVTVSHLFDIYGSERDAAIARSKIVLNMHFYDSAIFEVVRVSYLLANEACVVSEGDSDDPDLAPFADGLALAPHDGLVERCIALLNDPQERRRLADAGFSTLKSRRQSDLLRPLFRSAP